MEYEKNEHQNQKKSKRNILIIALISFSVVIIVLFPVMARFTGNLMYELAKYRQKTHNTDLSGLSKAMEIYGRQDFIPDFRKDCSTNMSTLAKAIQIYVSDFDKYPTPEKWCDLLREKYKVPADYFHCPLAKEGPCNYAINKNIADLSTTKDPNIVLIFETKPGWNQVGGPELLTTENHKGEGCNVVFLDSHVEFVETKDIGKLKWKPDENPTKPKVK
jgi:prepilin-type processing-associated H-X9-DG protein